MFTWTEEKNQLNKKKHGFYLSEIVDVFDDQHLIEWYDKEHSSKDEDRYICLGRLHDAITLFVVFTEQGDEIHLIMARKAESIEERLYYEYYKKETGGN
ncbi:MAG: BrnT family toxin [Spirochaetes bacterium]|nr:BrnT family toxin [Spirochaetota bacterium]